jgi:hypothetical protein
MPTYFLEKDDNYVKFENLKSSYDFYYELADIIKNLKNNNSFLITEFYE